MDDLHALPKFRDALSFLYVEHARIDRQDNSIALWDAEGCTPAPASSLAVLMLGPGTRITQSAITMLADNNCLVIWCGEENVRFYACGMGGTRSASAMLHQARLVSDPTLRLRVVKQMYWMRFGTVVDEALSIEQLRGMEGARVRDSYAAHSRQTGVTWTGRNYDRGTWNKADVVNRALSCANSCLYGVCHAAILSVGYSPALGFIHTGKQLSFVYDIADLYKSELTIPLAFEMAAQNPPQLERAVRYRMRDVFRDSNLLQRIIPDIRKVLGEPKEEETSPLDLDPALPTDLWTPEPEVEPEARPGDEQWGNDHA
ncbi:MAG TPA: type I-E CRISPR-associated endonuclease Cas1e [Abditibacteriaceae bacterium]